NVIKEEIGFDLRILTEAEEAYYSYHGGLSGLEYRSQKPVLVDIGGGSTEFIWTDNSGILNLISKPMGALRYTEEFLHHDPPLPSERSNLETKIQTILKILPVITGDSLIGVGGSITTLAAIILRLQNYDPEKIHGQKFSIEKIVSSSQKLFQLPVNLRKQIPGLEPARADIILAGITILSQLMNKLEFSSIMVSNRGLRFGLMLKLLGEIPDYTI
ncbi:MAG: hypothetical protein A2161_00915, partial [Candidatus Schekmanbacteria bacterium RBG_13_48_7]